MGVQTQQQGSLGLAFRLPWFLLSSTGSRPRHPERPKLPTKVHEGQRFLILTNAYCHSFFFFSFCFQHFHFLNSQWQASQWIRTSNTFGCVVILCFQCPCPLLPGCYQASCILLVDSQEPASSSSYLLLWLQTRGPSLWPSALVGVLCWLSLARPHTGLFRAGD